MRHRWPVNTDAFWLILVPLTLLAVLAVIVMAFAWLQGHALTLLGGVSLPSPLAESHALGARIAAVHAWLGDAILWLAGVHAAAGLFHHYVLKDGVLRSMLPHRDAGSR